MTVNATVGPFSFTFRPDGDDPGVGSVLLNAGDGVRSETAYSVTTAKWERFVRDLRSARDPRGYDPAKRRQDFETVARAIRELGNAWMRGVTPSYEIGSVLVSDAVSALSALAVAANVPPLEHEAFFD